MNGDEAATFEELQRHPDYLAFVASMRERPDDDVRRLAFADWLQDRGFDEQAQALRSLDADYRSRMIREASAALLDAFRPLATALEAVAVQLVRAAGLLAPPAGREADGK